MKKPSIYSDRYRNVKKRVRFRRKLIVILAALVLFLLFFVPYLNGKIKEFKANGNQFPNQAQGTSPLIRPTQTGGTNQGTKTEETSQATDSGPTSTQTEEPETLTHSLPQGGEVLIEFERIDQTSIRYLGVQGDEALFSFDISPKESQLLINAKSDQSLVLYGADLKPEDRSVNTYAHGDKGTLEREDYIKKPDFIWMGNPQFMTDDVILFESHMSRALDKTYIWYYKISEGIYKLISGTGSETTHLVGPAEGGYEVEIDGKLELITSNLQVAE